MTGRKFTIVHRYFWPQNYPYAQMLKDIALVSLDSFDKVNVLSSWDGTESEKIARSELSEQTGVKVSSIFLKGEKNKSLFRKSFNSIYYGLWIFIKLLFGRHDVVMIATTPPVIAAALTRWASKIKGFDYIYHCQDIHPEAMVLNGNLKRGFFYNLLRKVDQKNIDNALAVITLSKDMRKNLSERGCKTDHVHIINNFIFNSNDSMQDKSFNKPSNEKVSFLFAGSLGRLQNLELLIDAISEFKNNNNVQFTFMGDGIERKNLEKIVSERKISNVLFLGQRPLEEAVEAMRASDFGIVSIAKGISSVAFPSKAIMYLGNGLPVLALVENGTELQRVIDDYQVGTTAEPSDKSRVVSRIQYLIDNKNKFKSEDVQAVARGLYSKKNILKKFSKVFEQDRDK